MSTRFRFLSFFRSIICWPTLISVMGITLLLSLGTWQLYRMKWKESLLQQIADVIDEPVQPLSFLVNETSQDPQEFRKITVQGVFDPDIRLKWMARVYNGDIGYHLIMPFHLTTGATMLVDRGWVPQGIETVKTPVNEVTLTLMVRHSQKTTSFTPTNTVEKGELYSIQPKEIARKLGLMTLLPYYGVLLDKTDEPYPIAKAPALNISNNHFVYALTWYFLALALAVIYVMYIRRKNNLSSNLKP